MEAFRNEEYFDPKVVTYLKSKKDGFVSFKDVKEFGYLAIELKAGRKVKTDEIDHNTGFELIVKHGDEVKKYDEIVKIYSATALPTEFLERLHDNFIITEEKPADDKIIIEELR